LTSIVSAVEASKCPRRLRYQCLLNHTLFFLKKTQFINRFYIFLALSEVDWFRHLLANCLSGNKHKVVIVGFDPQNDSVRNVFAAEDIQGHATRLHHAHNYIRFYFGDYLPTVKKAIYIDADTLLTKNGDLVELYDSILNDDDDDDDDDGGGGGSSNGIHRNGLNINRDKNEKKPIIAACIHSCNSQSLNIFFQYDFFSQLFSPPFTHYSQHDNFQEYKRDARSD
jgi:hypothetical protein